MRPPNRVGPSLLTGSLVTQYMTTQPTRLHYIRLTNPTGGTIAATVAVVPVGMSPTSVHHVLSGQAIPGHDVFGWTGEIPLHAGDTIRALGDGLVFQATVNEEY